MYIVYGVYSNQCTATSLQVQLYIVYFVYNYKCKLCTVFAVTTVQFVHNPDHSFLAQSGDSLIGPQGQGTSSLEKETGTLTR